MKDFLFEVKEGLLISLKAIRANKVRSVLTTLGIIIGVFAVVLMSTAIKGINVSFQEGVASLGSDNLYIDKWEWFNNDTPWWELRNRKNITLDDYEKFQKLVKLPKAVAPTISTNKTVRYKDRSANFINIQGSTDDFISTTNLDFEEGRFFTEIESNGSRNVLIIGSEINDILFPDGNGLNKIVKIGGKKYKVIGVLTKQGSHVLGNWNPDKQVYTTIGSLFKNFVNSTRNSITINVRAENSLQMEDVKEEAIGAMRRVRGLSYKEENDFSINQQEGLLGQINSTMSVIETGGLAITGLALFVGAIGIMNIMFVSVKERTREIGIRKAIGAKKRTILGLIYF